MAPGGMRQLLNYEHGMDASDGTAAIAYVGGAVIAALFGKTWSWCRAVCRCGRETDQGGCHSFAAGTG